ncbi:MAG: P22 coat protein, partial [Dehalococcoidia bacterium]
LTLDIVSFRKQILDPAMQAISQALDYKLTGLYADIHNYIAYDATSEATKLANLANTVALLNKEKAPLMPRYAMVDETTQAGLIVVPSFLNAEKSGTTETLRNGSMGKLFGAEFFMNQNVRAHSWTGYGDLAGAIDSPAAADYPVGTSTIHVDALGSLVISKGTILYVTGDTTGGQQNFYVVTADVTIGSNEADIAIYPATKNIISDGAVVTLVTQSVAENLIYHKNAFALVFRPLEPPMGGAKAVQVNWRGLPLRMTYDYNMNTKANICSIDLLCGVKTLTPELAARLIKHT